MRERDLHETLHGVGLARGHHVVVALVLLQHQVHRLDVVAGEAPVALSVEVAHGQLGGQAQLDASHRVGDLASDELKAAARALVVEEDARRAVHVVRLAVVHGDVVAVHLGHAVRRARVERGDLRLRNLEHLAEHLA